MSRNLGTSHCEQRVAAGRGSAPTTGSPVRVQLRRTKGWKLPQNTVVVSRPTIWVNPYVNLPLPECEARGLYYAPNVTAAVAYFLGLMERRLIDADPYWRTELKKLRGKNLACWCRPDQRCHADVLLDLANDKLIHGVAERKP